MTISEQSRRELHRRLEEALGPDAAATLMEQLPPVGWADVATKRDLDAQTAATKRDLDAQTAATKRDIDALAVVTKRDFDSLEAEFAAHAAATKAEFAAHAAATKAEFAAQAAANKAEFAALRLELEAMEHRLRGDMYQAINAAITSQTRTVLFGLIGSNLTAVALGAAVASIR